VRLVLTPERVVIAESRRTLTSLRLYGLSVDQIVVNRVFPDVVALDGVAVNGAAIDGATVDGATVGGATADGATDDASTSQYVAESDHGSSPTAWLAGWNEAQRRGLAEVRHSFDPLPIVIAPYLAREPVGTDALAALARARDGEVNDVLKTAPTQGMTVRPVKGGYLLTLPLPLVTAAEVDLKRRDDELLVSVADHRRVLSLPSVLRRCVVTGAVVRNATLRVRFIPDAKLWPVNERESAARK
jgi:arsenite-transporting ATPase